MIAHEVNNPLSGVIGYAQVLKNRACDFSQGSELLDRIINEGERISRIVGGLLSFAYQGSGEKKKQSLEQIVYDALNLMQGQFKNKGISLDIDLYDNQLFVNCNAQQIEQVILNIFKNAHQALSEESEDRGTEKYIRVRAGIAEVDSQKSVRLSIANNGPHIPPEIMNRIREPFFTTKPIGRGTGLGLSISNDIMHDHGGSLEIKSALGEDTEMILMFPVEQKKLKILESQSL